MSSMNGEMVVETPAKGSVTTSLVCLKCPLSMFGRDFEVDLVCLPLSGMDVILGMNWLEYNHVHINCFSKTVYFSSAEEESEAEFLTTKQLKQLARDGILMFSLMASLSIENQAVIDKLCANFQKFFLMRFMMCRQKERSNFQLILFRVRSLCRWRLTVCRLLNWLS